MRKLKTQLIFSTILTLETTRVQNHVCWHQAEGKVRGRLWHLGGCVEGNQRHQQLQPLKLKLFCRCPLWSWWRSLSPSPSGSASRLSRNTNVPSYFASAGEMRIENQTNALCSEWSEAEWLVLACFSSCPASTLWPSSTSGPSPSTSHHKRWVDSPLQRGAKKFLHVWIFPPSFCPLT